MTINVYANDSIGMVVASKGNSYVNEKTILQQGSLININDVITTSTQSFVVIQLTDGSKITVRPSSTVSMDQYSYDGSDADEVKLNLVQGGLRIITGAIAKNNPDNYILETPVALMGVRGTEFSIILCDGNTC